MKNRYSTTEEHFKRCLEIMQSATTDYSGTQDSDFGTEVECDYTNEFDRKSVASLIEVVMGTDDSPAHIDSNLVDVVEALMWQTGRAVVEESRKWIAEHVSCEEADRYELDFDEY